MKPLVGVILHDSSETDEKLVPELRPPALRLALEGAYDLRDAQEVLARIESGAETVIPWSEVKLQLGL